MPPYSEREGGFVCNIAIARYATATLGSDPAADVTSDQLPLVRAVRKRTGVEAAVNIESDFPLGAGLGGSSAASAALLLAIAEWKCERPDRAAIAELGRAIEVEELGNPGGRQDHYAAAFGGALALTFTDSTAVRRLRVSDDTLGRLSARSILVYTGESRVSGDTITAVLGAYERRDTPVLRALGRMKEIARHMASALERGDLDALGEMLADHWMHQRSLHPSISTTRIDEIVARARANGALGSKAMGASGGGCVLVIGRPERMDALRAELRGLGELLEFSFDAAGATVLPDSAA